MSRGFERTGLPRGAALRPNDPDLQLLFSSLYHHGGLNADPPSPRDGESWVRLDLTPVELRVQSGGTPLVLATASGGVPVVEWGSILSKPTTLAGFGLDAEVAALIADFLTEADADLLYEALGAVAAHSSATMGVHGIADTAALVLTGDARLSNARTPTAHASSHGAVGSDPLALVDLAGDLPGARISSQVASAAAASDAALLQGNDSAYHRARANHTGSQVAATISDLTEVVQDLVGALVVAGANVTVTYNDAGATLTVAVPSFPWGSLTGVPSTFAPSAHHASHAAAGSDPVSLSSNQVASGIFSNAISGSAGSGVHIGQLGVGTGAVRMESAGYDGWQFSNVAGIFTVDCDSLPEAFTVDPTTGVLAVPIVSAEVHSDTYKLVDGTQWWPPLFKRLSANVNLAASTTVALPLLTLAVQPAEVWRLEYMLPIIVTGGTAGLKYQFSLPTGTTVGWVLAQGTTSTNATWAPSVLTESPATLGATAYLTASFTGWMRIDAMIVVGANAGSIALGLTTGASAAGTVRANGHLRAMRVA